MPESSGGKQKKHAGYSLFFGRLLKKDRKSDIETVSYKLNEEREMNEAD